MTPRERKIAVPIMAALLLCLATWWHGFQTVQSFDGISAMRTVKAATGQRLAVVVNQALHVLDDTGRRVARQDFQSLGLKAAPNDMDWTVDAAGRVEAWFFEDSPPKVTRCTWDEAALALRDCAIAMSGPQLKVDAGSLAIHMAIDRPGSRVFMADARSGTVQQFDLSGKWLGRSPASLGLNFPNRIRYLGNDTLLVADSDNHRLLWLSFPPAGEVKITSQLAVGSHDQAKAKARAAQSRVQDVAVGLDGSLWMLASRPGKKGGDVLVFDAALKPLARTQLPPGADPLIVDSLAGNALVADFSLVNLYRLSASGAYLGEFGDAAFRGELEPLQTQAKRARWLQQAAWMLGVAVLLLGIVLALVYGEKPKNRANFSADDKARIASSKPQAFSLSAALRFPVLLEPTAAALKNSRYLTAVIGLLIVVMLAFFFYFFFGVLTSGTMERSMSLQIGLTGLTVSGMTAAIGLLLWRAKSVPVGLKVFEFHVELVKGAKQIGSAPLVDVLASPFQVLVGRQAVAYAQSAGLSKTKICLFDQVLLDKVLLSRLPQKNLVSVSRLGWHQFKNQSLTVRIATAVALAFGIALQLWDAWRKLS